MKMRHLLPALGAAIALVLTACEQPTGPAGSALLPSVNARPQQAASAQTVDQHALGQSIPAFGGFFLDHGVPTAYLTDPSQRGAVASAVSDFLAAWGLGPSDLVARQGRFSYRQLETFFDRARTAAFAQPGGVFADLDEAHNRVTLGVENQGTAALVRASVDRLGLPDGAVSVVVSAPILPLADSTLQDRFDPIPAGVQIHFGNYLCSIGMIAEIGGKLGFITASHCTNTQGGVEGTQYYQPLSSVDPTVIAIETEDPTYFSSRQGPCPYAGARCRYSDASFAASTGARAFALGEIAQTTGEGSLTWNNSYYDVTGKASGNGVVGDSRGKVGRTTGYTTGTVSMSCVDTGVQGSNKVLLCQDWVEASGNSAIVGAGDSGSDVFKGTGNVTWWGGLWGGSSDGSTFVYSPASNIERELGTATVTGSGGGGTTPPPTSLTASFTYSCHFADCAFDASSTAGASSSATYAWTFGDGNSGTGVTTSHTYGGPQTYTVNLTVTDGSSQDGASHSITCQNKGPNLQCK